MNTVNAAIIGGGAIHAIHAEALQQLPNVRLRAIAETDINKGRQLAALYDCHFYHDYREMLWDDAIDVVHICTPHYLHKPMILAALAAGKHVFCEKPAVMRALDVAEIETALAHARGKLGICYQNRLNPTSLAMKQQLQEGVIGKMLAMKAVLTWSRGGSYYTASPWRGKSATEGGCLLINQAIHTLDLMQWFGEGATRVKGWSIAPGLPVPSTVRTAPWRLLPFATARVDCFMPATATPPTHRYSWKSTAIKARCSLREASCGISTGRLGKAGKRRRPRWQR